MKTVIDLSVPKSWQELPDKELRYVFRLLNGSFTLAQVKARCLLRWAGMRVLRQEGALFVVRYKKQVFPISALQITEAISNYYCPVNTSSPCPTSLLPVVGHIYVL